MTVIATAAVLVWLAMIVADGTPIGRALRGWLVERPAAALNGIDRKRALVFALVFGGTGLVAWALGHEAARGFAMLLPELAGWSTMIEVTVYLDTLVAVFTAASAARFGMVRQWLGSILRVRPATPRARRAKPSVRMPANDDEDGRRLALAA